MRARTMRVLELLGQAQPRARLAPEIARLASSHLNRRCLSAVRRQVFLTVTPLTFRRDWHSPERRSGSEEQPTRPGDLKEDP